jgi:hypothetical protein
MDARVGRVERVAVRVAVDDQAAGGTLRVGLTQRAIAAWIVHVLETIAFDMLAPGRPRLLHERTPACTIANELHTFLGVSV